MADFNLDDIVYTVKSGAEKVKTGAEKIAKDAFDKGGVIVEGVKLQYAIRNVKAKIDEAYQDLGEYIYDEFADEEIEGPISEKCHHITSLYREYKALSDELSETKNAVVCPRCSELNDKTKNYCGECGAPLK